MLIVTYKSYSKILDKEFVNTKEVKSLDDFRFYSLALNLNAEILKVEKLN